jgi:membrane protease YdiL (CAAX protease family)
MRAKLASWVGRHPIGAFLAIAFGWTWLFTVLGMIDLGFALLALFGPAIGAVAVARIDGTWSELRPRLTDRRFSLGTWLVALAIPFGVAAIARVVLVATGQPIEGIGAISAIEAAIFVLVIGEEIGWRSFLQPRLRGRMSLGMAGVVTGLIWSMWHLPMYLAPDQGLTAFVAFTAWVVPLAVVMGIVAEATRFSAIVATVLHGAANIATPIVLPGVDRPTWLILGGLIYAIGGVTYLVWRRRTISVGVAGSFVAVER